ncbi:MAG TPA: FHA domain-containing protein [Polyangiaceae bacterium]|nr:FHA domain-containing protein [Polyangiaceae bacterium]
MSENRGVAARIARLLVQKDRPDDAVALLSAWAARGPNDPAGQGLLAEALRINPAAKAAQQAFERMEGIAGTHTELDAAIERFDVAELERLQKGLESPTFKRAQIGFNNNIRAKDQVFHIQTEDSGLNNPHVITHLFADGGRVIKSHKRIYAAAIDTEADIGAYVRQLMKAQHLEMVFALRDGRFDDILAGKAIGGLDVLEHYPDVDMSKVAGKGRARKPDADARDKAEGAAPAAAPTISTPPPPPPAAAASAAAASAAAPATSERGAPEAAPAKGPVPPARQRSKTGVVIAPAGASPAARPVPELYTLHVLRSLGGGPGRYAVGRRDTVIGGAGEISLPGETFCHPREAMLKYREGRLFVERLEGQNGVFLRIQKPVVMGYGEEFIVGDQLLRVEENPLSDDAPDPDPTYFYSSPRWPSAFRVVQILAGGARGACLVARGSTLQVGSVIGDLILSGDPLVDAQHCLVEEQASSILLTDLESRNGVFVRTRGRQELVNGDEIVIGRTHLVVDIEPQPQ